MGASAALLSGALFFACGPGPAAVSDGGIDAGVDAGACECDDDLYCNGAERCVGATCEPGEPPCDDPADCDEEADRCAAACDVDGDGHEALECGGDDCDDANPNRFTGNLEQCDAEGLDEDCDPTTLGPDGDADGEPSDECCNTNADGDLVCGGDCDDERSGIHPGAADGCGGGDEDCDGEIDEEPNSTFYRDQDGDNYGDDAESVIACSQPSGYTTRGDDCDDDPFANPDANEVNPGATEICDSVDNDCVGGVDDGLICDCDVSTDTSRGCGVSPELDGVGICRLGTQTCQPSGMWTECTGATAPRAETCNNLDDDCDGVPDDGVLLNCYLDADMDGYAAADGPPPLVQCTCTAGYTSNAPATSGADCDDDDDTIHPGAAEVCDRIDSDCSVGGATEMAEDRDGDGHSSSSSACTGGYPKDDCDDRNADRHPGAPARGEGYCAPGCECDDGRCQTPGRFGACIIAFPGCATGDSDRRYDYDCDRSDEPVGSTSWSCPACPAGAACGGGSGVTYGGSPACGSLVTHWTCGSGGCGDSSCGYRTFRGRLPCR